MSLYIDIDASGLDAAGLGKLTAALRDRAPLHARMAADVSGFVQDFGQQKADVEHRTATMLGAKPTGHLEKAYAGIQDESDAKGMRLLVPKASRLRAAFGPYTLVPKNSKYLTLPTHKDSYGRRAREFDGLAFIRLGGGAGSGGTGSQALLVRKDDQGKMEVMYFLTKSANIPEDASLLPFDQIGERARNSAADFYDDLIEEGLLA